MITLHYIGPAKRGAAAWLGHAATVWGQRRHNPVARQITHTEALLGGPWYNAAIGSSSIVDGGVRVRYGVTLNPAHWIVLSLPAKSGSLLARFNAEQWFEAHDGEDYDALGAAGSVVPALIPHRSRKWYCTEAVGASYGFTDPHTMCPAAFYTLQLAFGAEDITANYFNGAQ